MKLRIAMVGACPYPVPQGSQVLLRDTAVAMREREHDVRLVVYGHGLGREFSGLPIHRCRRIPGDTRTGAGPSLAKPFLDLALVATLRRIVREHRIDVVHAHNYEALLVALLAGKRPIVYHAHNVMADELPFYFNGRAWAARAGRMLDHLLPPRADAIVAPHRRLAGHLVLRGCPKPRVHIIPPPADGEAFAPPEDPTAHPAVLYTGNLDAYQNLELLHAAMTRVRRKLPDARLRIATAQTRAVPGTEHLHTPDFAALRACLAEDAVVAVPRVSWSGYPIKLLNAMAAGKAVVACASSAYPLTHEHDGLVVPDNDPAAFAEALIRLLTTPKLRAELGRRARETVRTRHTPAQFAEQLEALDEALLAARGHSPGEAAAPEDMHELS